MSWCWSSSPPPAGRSSPLSIPNETLSRTGNEAAQQQIDECMGRAAQFKSGVPAGEVARDTAVGGGVGAAAGAVGGAITGNCWASVRPQVRRPVPPGPPHEPLPAAPARTGLCRVRRSLPPRARLRSHRLEVVDAGFCDSPARYRRQVRRLHVIFDLDNTLYSPATGVVERVDELINRFMMERLALGIEGRANALPRALLRRPRHDAHRVDAAPRRRSRRLPGRRARGRHRFAPRA